VQVSTSFAQVILLLLLAILKPVTPIEGVVIDANNGGGGYSRHPWLLRRDGVGDGGRVIMPSKENYIFGQKA
jgi:hypothetical protein